MPIQYGLYLGFNAKPWQTVEQDSHDPQHALGAFFDDEFGNRFRYAYNGAAALRAGNMVQSAALGGAATTLQSAMPVVSCALGSKVINVTRNTTDQAASLFAEGKASIFHLATTSVYTRRIKDNTLIAAASGTITLYESLPVLLVATDDTVAAMVNPYKNIVVIPTTTPTGKILGGVLGPVEINHYCWVQTRGWFGGFINDATTNLVQVGPVYPGGTTPGSLVTAAAQGEITEAPVVSPAIWLDNGSGLFHLMCE
jgi:hypothetical protein